MKEAHKIKSRREFMKDGLRTVVLSGLAFAGLSLGWRRASSSGKDSSCIVDLPCRICSQLPGCRKPEAITTKQKSKDSRSQFSPQKRGA
ncbi:MAG: hypothetical protein V3S65_06090 [Candidatus Aminicenantaceae bacterium]